MQRLKPFLPALSIFCLALLVRVLYNVIVAHDYYPRYDSLQYQLISFNLLDEHCFCLHPHTTIVDRAPLWPWLMAGISLMVGRADIYDRLLLCCTGSGTCLFIFLFACDLFNKRVGLIAGVIACIYPALYLYDGWMYTESLYTFFLIAICYCLYRIQCGTGEGKCLWIACGVLLALLSLIRPNGIIVIALVILWTLFMVWRKLLHFRALRNVALTALVACALIAPWTIRNYRVSGSFIPVAIGDGTVLLGAYNDQELTTTGPRGSWINPHNLAIASQVIPISLFPLNTCDPLCEIQREDASKNAAIQWIETHLSSMPIMMVYHFINFWTPNTYEADMPMSRFPEQLSSRVLLQLAQALPIPIFILAALGLCVTPKKRWRELLFPCAIILLTVGEALAYYGSSRFRAPIEPILVLLAAGAIWWLTEDDPGTLRWNRKQRQQKARERKPCI